MRTVVLSDAHGNWLYFSRCMREIDCMSIEKIFFLGDCFGYMHDGNQILHELRKRNAFALMGNHEAMLLGICQYESEKEAVYGLKYDLNKLDKDDLLYLEHLRSSYECTIGNKKTLFVHGRPEAPLDGYLYENDDYHWKSDRYDLIFMGHTHYPYIKQESDCIFVNVGSCGLPRDEGNKPSFAVYDSDTEQVSMHRVHIEKKEVDEICGENIHSQVAECLRRTRFSASVKSMI